MHVLGTGVPRCLGVARSASSHKAALTLGCSLTPGLRISFGRVTCMARAASVPGLWTPGFLLLCGVCVLVWVPRWLRHSWPGSRVCVLGFGFRLCPAISGWGLWCERLGFGSAVTLGTPGWGLGRVCLVRGFGRAPPVLAGFGGVCVPVGGFPALHFFSFGCWGPWPLACAPSVSRQPLAGRSVAWGCAGVAVGEVCPPPFLCFFRLRGGVVLGPVVSWLCGARRCLSRSWASWSPSPLPLLFGCIYVFFFVRPPFLCWGVCRRVRGVLSSVGPLLSAGCCQVWLGGSPVPFQGGPWVSPLVLPGWGVCPPLVEWVRGLSVVCLSLAPPPFFPAGARSWLGGGFPPAVMFVFSLFFRGGGLPDPLSAFCGLVQALVGIRCG